MAADLLFRRRILLAITGLLVFVLHAVEGTPAAVQSPSAADWPAIGSQQRPWTRWWWHGSAVDRAGITAELESLRAAGIGGVEITPIYGVIGGEARDPRRAAENTPRSLATDLTDQDL